MSVLISDDDEIFYHPGSTLWSLYATAILNGYEVEQIIRNGPATIVKWKDGTKTIVKRMYRDRDDPYMAFCAALAKKMYGGTSTINKMIARKTVNQDEEDKK